MKVTEMHFKERKKQKQFHALFSIGLNADEQTAKVKTVTQIDM